MNGNSFTADAAGGAGVAAALRSLPQKSPPRGGWKRVLERHESGRRARRSSRRYWGGGLAVAAGVAAAVIGVRLGGWMFFGVPAEQEAGGPRAEAAVAGDMLYPEEPTAFAAMGPESGQAQAAELARMDLDALIAFSQFQEERLRALPVAASSRPGRVLEVDAFGLATEIEDQIALLDEGLITVSLNSEDQSVPRRLLRERALLMDDLFSLRRAEAARAGYFHADF